MRSCKITQEFEINGFGSVSLVPVYKWLWINYRDSVACLMFARVHSNHVNVTTNQALIEFRMHQSKVYRWSLIRTSVCRYQLNISTSATTRTTKKEWFIYTNDIIINKIKHNLMHVKKEWKTKRKEQWTVKAREKIK